LATNEVAIKAIEKRLNEVLKEADNLSKCLALLGSENSNISAVTNILPKNAEEISQPKRERSWSARSDLSKYVVNSIYRHPGTANIEFLIEATKMAKIFPSETDDKRIKHRIQGCIKSLDASLIIRKDKKGFFKMTDFGTFEYRSWKKRASKREAKNMAKEDSSIV
jgi:hypothetical protein